jgi:hypothetical protein
MKATVRIRSAHADGTRCTHPRGDQECPGFDHFTARCSSCKPIVRSTDLVTLRTRVRKHLAMHAEQPAVRGVEDVHLPAPVVPTA